MADEEKKPPERTFRAGNVSASVWSKETEQDGRTVVRYSVRIQKRYQDSKGSWRSSDYFFPDELTRLCLVARKAHEYCVLKESEE